MMENLSLYIVLVSYLALVVVLSCFHVPSLASNVSIFRNSPEVSKYYSESFQRIFSWPLGVRVVVFMLPLLVIYATFAYPLLVTTAVLSDPKFIISPNLHLAMGLIAIGLAFVFISIAIIRRQNSQTGDSFKLHTESVFKLTRNPGLVGMYIYAFGLWCLMPTLIFLIGLVVYVLYMHFKVLMEEDYLSNRFGSDYRQYLHQTARYLII